MVRALPLLVLPLPAMAELNVVTDIAPIHSITAEIMGDTGTPTLLLPANADAHHFQFRPSDAAALQNADVVVMVGDTLTRTMPPHRGQSGFPNCKIRSLNMG